MTKPNILRLGICACTTRFHSRFEKQTITVNGTTLRIQEMIISEEDQREAVRASRVHFFLDLHRFERGPFSTTLSSVDLISSGVSGRKERVYFGSRLFREIAQNRRWWQSKDVPRREQILKAIKKILANMGVHKFKEWRARMA